MGLEQVGCVFGKLQDVAGVCWLGVDGQDRACGQRTKEETEKLEGQWSGSSPPPPLPPWGLYPSHRPLVLD